VLITGQGNNVEANYVGLDETGANALGNVLDGIHVAGDQNLVRGNTSADNNSGVELHGTGNTVIANALGTDATMTSPVPNHDGVLIEGSANVIGGDEEHEPNVISGNYDAGVRIATGATNRVEGNRIGTDAGGLADLGNDDGVLVQASFNEIVGNLLSGNDTSGVKIARYPGGPIPSGNDVEDNVIGLDAGESAALPNERGIIVTDSPSNSITGNLISDNLFEGVLIEAVELPTIDSNWLAGNTISDNGESGVHIDEGENNFVGVPDWKPNTITGNGDDGVTVASGDNNTVINNAIAGNADIGIDLDDDGPTVNDGPFDLDTGANGLQNRPTITRRTRHVPGNFTDVSWQLESAASSYYRLDFYAVSACDDPDAEPPQLVGTSNVKTGTGGTAKGTTAVKVASGSDRIMATATVTDPNGVFLESTSELSPCA
jgi:parallel beta-helix repeat protein